MENKKITSVDFDEEKDQKETKKRLKNLFQSTNLLNYTAISTDSVTFSPL